MCARGKTDKYSLLAGYDKNTETQRHRGTKKTRPLTELLAAFSLCLCVFVSLCFLELLVNGNVVEIPSAFVAIPRYLHARRYVDHHDCYHRLYRARNR